MIHNLNWRCFLCYFSWIANYQIVMISFIKLFPVIRFFLLQLMLGEVSCFAVCLNWCWILTFLTDFVWICVGVFFLGRRRVVSFFVCLSSLLLRWILLVRMLSYCAPSSGEIWNLLAAFSVYVFFAMGRWFTTWIDAVFLCYFPWIANYQIVMI